MRIIIATHGPTFAIGLGVLGMVALGSAGWLYTHPPTTEVTNRVEKVPVKSELHTRTHVTGDSSLYSEGTTLRDQPVYFTSATPTVRLILQTTIPVNNPATVDQSIELVIRGVRDGSAFWSEARTLNTEHSTLTNDTMTMSATVNIRRVETRVGAVAEEIGAAGEVDVLIRLNTTYETARYSGNESELVPVQLTDRSYAIEPVTFGKTHSTSVTRTVTVPRQRRLGYEFPATAGGVAVLMAGLIGILYTRFKETDALEYRLQKERYAEWVSTGKLPQDSSTQTISLRSLEDLVDVAIDTNKRVIYDEMQDRYAVIDGTVVYDYTVDGSRTETDDDVPTPELE